VCQRQEFIFSKFHVLTPSPYLTGEEEMQIEREKIGGGRDRKKTLRY
jgi:hypothetical protein